MTVEETADLFGVRAGTIKTRLYRAHNSCLATLLLARLGPVSARAATVHITINKLVYTPAEATARVGETIGWVKKEALAHTATATNGHRNVMIGPNKTSTFVLKKAGTVDYFCKSYLNMKARLIIAP